MSTTLEKQNQAKKDLLLLLEAETRNISGVLRISQELMHVLFGVPGIETSRHIVCSAGVYWAESYGYHLVWMPTMDEAEFRDYDAVMKKYNRNQAPSSNGTG